MKAALSSGGGAHPAIRSSRKQPEQRIDPKISTPQARCQPSGSVFTDGGSDESATPNRLPPAVDPIRTLAHPSAAGTPAAAPSPTSARASYPPCRSPRLGARTVNPVWAAAHPSAAGTPGADPLAAWTWLPPSILPRRRRIGRIDQDWAGQHRSNQEGGEFAHDIFLLARAQRHGDARRRPARNHTNQEL